MIFLYSFTLKTVDLTGYKALIDLSQRKFKEMESTWGNFFYNKRFFLMYFKLCQIDSFSYLQMIRKEMIQSQNLWLAILAKRLNETHSAFLSLVVYID